MSPWAVEAASLEDGVTLDPQDALPAEAVVVVRRGGRRAPEVEVELPPPPHPESGTAMADGGYRGHCPKPAVAWMARSTCLQGALPP